MLLRFKNFNTVFSYKLGSKALKYLISCLNNKSLLIYKLFFSYIKSSNISIISTSHPKNNYSELVSLCNKEEKVFVSSMKSDEKEFLNKLLSNVSEIQLSYIIKDNLTSFISNLVKKKGLKLSGKK